jgi:hypothetical protein
MALYGVTNVSATTPALQNLSSTTRTHLQLAAQTTGLRRAFIYEFDIGASGQPNTTDCEIAWTVIQQSTAGTGGVSMTINKLDSVDAAATSVAIGNIATTEPTGAETAVIWALGANQRASYRWVVAPGGPGELVVPATNVNGIGIRAKSSAYTSTVSAGMLFRE